MARIKPQALLQQSKKKKTPSRISVTTIITFTLIVILIALSLYAAYQYWYPRQINDLHTNLNNFEQAAMFEEPKKASRPSYAVLDTSKGSVTLEIYKDAFPEVVDKFINLCQNGYFKGVLFHHVVKNYAILGGAKQTQGTAEDWTLKEQSQSHLAISPKHEAFMLGTKTTKEDSEGFELLITTAPIPDQNGKLILFGRVIKGEDVVQEIEEVETDENYQPKVPVEINDVTVKQDLWTAV
ncbi:peptidyl-prolyl cis-trans isomerase CYP21-4-like isoform X1 [Iris pallida]|uniref:Peptidyl-prolyl cis-trans isomerase n=1 Tax=Iris pallida TaxID=29817 RepID=A0AAX6HXS5_IRIPA|nr:peptidyl-prolyl cis-trans isomerase CYP21-4-like isoform X1 [Iris pallida]